MRQKFGVEFIHPLSQPIKLDSLSNLERILCTCEELTIEKHRNTTHAMSIEVELSTVKQLSAF
jgi:hypothetical protein